MFDHKKQLTKVIGVCIRKKNTTLSPQFLLFVYLAHEIKKQSCFTAALFGSQNLI